MSLNPHNLGLFPFDRENSLIEPSTMKTPSPAASDDARTAAARKTSMKKILIILSAFVALPFAANQMIIFAEKCETYQARVVRENIENTQKIAALLARVQAQRESSKSEVEQPFGHSSNAREIVFLSPDSLSL
jgi:hypothetical protein